MVDLSSFVQRSVRLLNYLFFKLTVCINCQVLPLNGSLEIAQIGLASLFTQNLIEPP